MRLRRTLPFAAAVLAACGLIQSCATLGGIASALANLQRLKFRIGDVRDFRLLGIDVGGKAKLSDFAATDLLKVAQSYSAKKLPVSFVMDVLAVNPNDGTNGAAKTTSTLTGLECRLLIDGKPTVTGNIDEAIEIPGTGQETVVPIRLSLDLFDFFAGKRYEDLVNLALAIGGRGGSPARLALDAQPAVSTPLGPVTYPGRITIVSAEFR